LAIDSSLPFTVPAPTTYDPRAVSVPSASPATSAAVNVTVQVCATVAGGAPGAGLGVDASCVMSGVFESWSRSVTDTAVASWDTPERTSGRPPSTIAFVTAGWSLLVTA
jgi:hypothetical protein